MLKFKNGQQLPLGINIPATPSTTDSPTSGDGGDKKIAAKKPSAAAFS